MIKKQAHTNKCVWGVGKENDEKKYDGWGFLLSALCTRGYGAVQIYVESVKWMHGEWLWESSKHKPDYLQGIQTVIKHSGSGINLLGLNTSLRFNFCNLGEVITAHTDFAEDIKLNYRK